MGNGVNNNEFMKKLQETVMNQSWMKELYASNRAEQQAKIKGVFTVVADNDVSAAEKKKLEAQAETLQEKVERLEAKMAVLEEELAKNADIIDEKADEIVELAAKAKDGSQTMEEEQKQLLKEITKDVFAAYESGKYAHLGADYVTTEIRSRMENNSNLKGHKRNLEDVLDQLDGKEAEVGTLLTDAEKWINQRNILKAQYGSTKSTYDLLNASITRIGANETSYTNTDFSKDRPIYSPAKANVVAKYSEDTQINVLSKNTQYKEGSTSPYQGGLKDIKEKYGKYLGTKATGSDTNSYDNKAIQNLNKALGEGLMEDLIGTGMSYAQLTDFFAENFSGANIKKNNGKLSVPYGHGDKAQATFTKLMNGLKKYDTSFKGALNTWDKDKGNTIDSNPQIASLAENYSTIIDDFAKNGFTFKEAMYAMFNPDSGIFKDSGVVYNKDTQGKTNKELNYFIEFAGDDKTANMYKEMSDKIYKTWGVKPSRGADAEQYKNGETDGGGDDDGNRDTSRTDPIYFNLGNNENDKYAFVIDRDGDGAFTNAEDFVGGSTDKTWLEDLKSLDTNEDGKLTGDELKELKLLGTKYKDNSKTSKDNNEYVPEKTKTSNGYVRTVTSDVEYNLTNAAAMGIEEIDLNAIEQNAKVGTTQKMTYVDENGNETVKDVVDANGNLKFEDSFTFKMNGQDVTAKRQDETNEFMEAIYGDAYGKGFKLGFREDQVDEIMAKDYGEYDQFEESYGDVFANINILKNAGQIAEDSRVFYNDSLQAVKDMVTIESLKAGNKAASEKNTAGWDTIKQRVMDAARAAGVEYNEEQMEGIYTLDAKFKNDPEGIVQEYKRQLNMEDEYQKKQTQRRSAWEALILTAKAGVATSAAEIKSMIADGKTPEEVVKILKDAEIEQGVTYEVATSELGFDMEREEEIYTAFNKVFNDAGLDDSVVDALAKLCVEQQNDREYMVDKSGEQLARQILAELFPDKEITVIREPDTEDPTAEA